MKKAVPVILIVALCGCSEGEQSKLDSQPISVSSLPSSAVMGLASRVSPASSVEMTSSPSSGVVPASGVAPASGVMPASGVGSTPSNDTPPTGPVVASAQEPPDTTDNHAYEQKTPYGVVQLDELRLKLLVNGKTVFSAQNDELIVNGAFSLPGEEVVQFDDVNTGSGGIPSQIYFLLLKNDEAPRILTNSRMEKVGGSEKTWQEGNAIYVDIGYEHVAKLESDKIIIKGARYPMDEGDCETLYDLTMKYCVEGKEQKEACDARASHDPSVMVSAANLSLGEITGLNVLMHEHPGFDRKGLTAKCIAWCEGKKITLEQFKKAVCSIK